MVSSGWHMAHVVTVSSPTRCINVGVITICSGPFLKVISKPMQLVANGANGKVVRCYYGKICHSRYVYQLFCMFSRLGTHVLSTLTWSVLMFRQALLSVSLYGCGFSRILVLRLSCCDSHCSRDARIFQLTHSLLFDYFPGGSWRVSSYMVKDLR